RSIPQCVQESLDFRSPCAGPSASQSRQTLCAYVDFPGAGFSVADGFGGEVNSAHAENARGSPCFCGPRALYKNFDRAWRIKDLRILHSRRRMPAHLFSRGTPPTMTDLIRRLHWLLTTDSQSLQQTEFLLAQVRILRAKFPSRVPITAGEKQLLLKLGDPLGDAAKGLVAIVTPRTFQNWRNAEKASADNAPPTGTAGGRPRIPQNGPETIVRLAKENGWGYTRIKGELAKLGLHPSRSTIVNVLRENGFDIGPDRSEGTWFEFLKREAATLWACDFFSVRAWTALGCV